MRRLCGVVVLLAAIIGGSAALVGGSSAVGATVVARATFAAKPSSVIEETDGGAGGVLEGRGLAHNTGVKITSTDMTNGCPGGPGLFIEAFSNGSFVTTDHAGSFNLAFGGLGCLPGLYHFSADDGTSFLTSTFTIKPPAPSGRRGLTLNPSRQAATDTNKDVATTLIISGLAPSESISIDSPKLENACPGTGEGNVEIAERLDGFFELPQTVTVDLEGNDLITLDADNCGPGSYPIIVKEVSGLRRTFTANFVITRGA